MAAVEVPYTDAPDPDGSEMVASLRAENHRLRRRLDWLVAEQKWAEGRLEELTARCARLSLRVRIERDAEGLATEATDAEPAGSEAAGAGASGLAAALRGEPGARLAVAVAAAVGDLSAMTDPTTTDPRVDAGCIADLSNPVLVELATAAHRVAAWAGLASTLAADELARRCEADSADAADPERPWARDLGFRAAVAETATACVVSEYLVTARIDTVRALPTRLPGLWHLVAAGRVDLDRARMVHEKTLHLTTDMLTRLEPSLLVKALSLTMAQLRVWLDRAIARVDPEAYAQQAREALDHRGVSFRSAGRGMGRMAVTASVADIETARIIVEALAAAAVDEPGQGRLPAARRADVVLDLIAAALDPEPDPEPDQNQTSDEGSASDVAGEPDGEPCSGLPVWDVTRPGGSADPRVASPRASYPDRPPSDGPPSAAASGSQPAPTKPDPAQPVPPGPSDAPATTACRGPNPTERFTDARIHVTVPLSVVLGGYGVSEVAGYGPVSEGTVRELLAALQRMSLQATYRCLIIDDTEGSPTHGTVLGIGRAPLALVRAATGLLRELVQARAQCCSFPGCRRQAMTCQIDHRVPHGEGGVTCECNLQPLCAHHHRLRDRGFTPHLVIPRPRPGSTTIRGRASPVITRWTTPAGRTVTTDTEHPPW